MYAAMAISSLSITATGKRVLEEREVLHLYLYY